MSDWTHYLGPVGYGYNKLKGNDTGSFTSYLDPGDILGKQASEDVKNAGHSADMRLQAMSQQAWDRQMAGLQKALSSMNNYNGILANLNGTPGAQNYYDPSGVGGVASQDPRMTGRPMPPPAAPPPAGAGGPATEARRGPGHF